MSPTACVEPLDVARLVDYWLDDLAPDEQERVEEHLLGCAECSERLRDLTALASGTRRLTDQGVVRAIVPSAFLESLVGEGLRVRTYRLTPGGSAQCTVAPSDDLVAARLAADLRGVERIDLVRCDAEGREQNRLSDIPVGAAAQEVVLLERIDRVRALPACVQRLKLVAPGADGERLLGEYTLVHTPWSHD